MAINATKLHKELQAAGLPVVGVSSDGRIDYSREIITGEKSLEQSIVAAHDPVDHAAIRESEAIDHARLVTQLAKVTPDQAAAYIDSNVTDMQSAKAGMKLMARMIIAIRDKCWPGLPDE